MTPEKDAEKAQSPLEFLQERCKDAPTPAQIDAWKQQVPNARVQFFCPDGKRFFILRGITGLEYRAIQEFAAQNSKDPDYEFRIRLAEKAVLWTNTSGSHKLDDQQLRLGTAGLPETLHAIVSQLSDFYDPVQLFNLTADL